MASEKNLNAVFSDIANSIRSKKGTTGTIQPVNMADEIDSIETGSSEKSFIYKALEKKGTDWSYAFYAYQNANYTSVFYHVTEFDESIFPPSSNVTNMNYMFKSCSKLVKIPLINTSKVVYMDYMFSSCYDLETIPLFDTSNVKGMSNMFSYCYNLKTIPQLDTSKVINMSYMFSHCYNLKTIPQLDTSNVTDMSNMFSYCSALETIPLINTSKVTNMYQMFYNSNLKLAILSDTSNCTNMSRVFLYCSKLEKIDIAKLADNNSSFAQSCYSLKTVIIRTMDTIPSLSSSAFSNCYHFDGTNNSAYNPNGAKDAVIYVPDDKVETLKTETNWSVFADIIKPLSELVE